MRCISLFTTLAALSVAALGQTALAASGTWNVDAAGNWGDSAKWLDGTIADGVDATANLTYSITAGRTLTVDANRTIGNIYIRDPGINSNEFQSWNVNNSSSSVLTLSTSTGKPTITVTQAYPTNNLVSTNITVPLAGTQGLVKEGIGALFLNGVGTTLTGGITVNNGTLSTYNSANLNGNKILINENGTVASNVYTTAGWLTSGLIDTASTGTLGWTQSAETIDMGALGYHNLYLGSWQAYGATTFSGSLTPGSNGYLLGGGDYAGANAILTVSSNLATAAPLTVRGRVVLSGTNAITSATINKGRLTFNNAAAMGTIGANGITINAGGTLEATTTAGYASITEWLASGKITTDSAGAIAFTGSSSAENVNLTAYPNLYLGATKTNYCSYSGVITPGSNGYLIGNTSSKIDMMAPGGFTGAHPMTVDVLGGLVWFNFNSSYTGDTTIKAGTLSLYDGASPIPHGVGKGNVIVNSEGILDTATLNITINGLSGSGTVMGGAFGFTIGDGDANGDFSGVVQNGSGALKLTKTGSGTQVLSGVNTYTGLTSIVAGILEIAGSGSINGTSGVTVNGATAKLMINSSVALTKGVTVTKGTLGGSGTINAAVALTADSVLSPGNSIGDLTIGSDLALAGSIEMEIDKNPTVAADLLNLGSYALTYGGTLNVTGSNVGSYASGDSFNLFDAGSFGGAFAAINLPTLSGGLAWDTSGLATEGTISVVPEPGTLALLATGLFGLLAYAWRKRK